jgi:hypothetical protein
VCEKIGQSETLSSIVHADGLAVFLFISVWEVSREKLFNFVMDLRFREGNIRSICSDAAVADLLSKMLWWNKAEYQALQAANAILTIEYVCKRIYHIVF